MSSTPFEQIDSDNILWGFEATLANYNLYFREQINFQKKLSRVRRRKKQFIRREMCVLSTAINKITWWYDFANQLVTLNLYVLICRYVISSLISAFNEWVFLPTLSLLHRQHVVWEIRFNLRSCHQSCVVLYAVDGDVYLSVAECGLGMGTQSDDEKKLPFRIPLTATLAV